MFGKAAKKALAETLQQLETANSRLRIAESKLMEKQSDFKTLTEQLTEKQASFKTLAEQFGDIQKKATHLKNLGNKIREEKAKTDEWAKETDIEMQFWKGRAEHLKKPVPSAEDLLSALNAIASRSDATWVPTCKTKDYEEALELITAFKRSKVIAKGCTVKVLDGKDLGVGSYLWVTLRNENIGQEFKVLSVANGSSGVICNLKGSTFTWPIEWLEYVEG